MGVTDTNLVRFRAAVAGALAHLESRREEVNDLNVFPVADGDTGDNMALTLRAVLAELDRLQGSNEARTIDEIGREEIVQSVARAALLGARGNSGVILSQLIRGAAEELVSRPGELIDATLIGAALANAADRAYSSVREPAEGTILTVAREMAHQIVTDLAHSPESPRLDPDAEPRLQDAAIAAALERAVTTGQESVKRGPELLAALRDAGVVDAGGYGLTIIFAGVVAALRGDDPPELDHYAPARISHPEHHSSTYRFCTNFAVTGTGLSSGRFIAPLEQLGDSVLVVGDTTTLKVHVHTDEPERATAVFAQAGEVSRLDVADMRLQVSEREQRLRDDGGGIDAEGRGVDGIPPAQAAGRASVDGPRVRCGAVAVVSGDGLAAMFEAAGRAHDRRRPDAQPLHLRSAGGDPRGAGRGGGGAAELGERDHGRRARGRAVGQAGAGGAHNQPAGRSRRRGRAGVRSHCGGERAGAGRGARPSAHGCGRAGRARRRAGTLRAGRGGRVRGGRGGRLGRARADAAGGARRRSPMARS